MKNSLKVAPLSLLSRAYSALIVPQSTRPICSLSLLGFANGQENLLSDDRLGISFKNFLTIQKLCVRTPAVMPGSGNESIGIGVGVGMGVGVGVALLVFAFSAFCKSLFFPPHFPFPIFVLVFALFRYALP